MLYPDSRQSTSIFNLRQVDFEPLISEREIYWDWVIPVENCGLHLDFEYLQFGKLGDGDRIGSDSENS